MRTSLCYVVSHYSRTEHTVHLDRLLELLAEEVDVHFVAWTHSATPHLPFAASTHLMQDRAAWRPVRMVRLVTLAWRLRRRGCRVFFIRIAHHVALVLGLLQPVLRIRVYLWHSGMGDVDPPAGSRGIIGLARRVTWRANLLSLRMAIRRVAALVTAPPSMAARYVERYGADPARVIVLPNDVDVTGLEARRARADRGATRGRLGLREEDPCLLYAGSVSALRFGAGGRLLRDTVSGVLAGRKAARIVIAGLVADREFERWATSTEPSDRLHLLGPVEFDRLVDFYVAADLFVLPVQAAGFPRVLLEAMALRVPFVAFDVGGIRDIASPPLDRGLVPPGDTEEFVARVLQVLDSQQLRAELARAGAHRVREFASDRVAREFLGSIVRAETA